jgi:hypothetical protein
LRVKRTMAGIRYRAKSREIDVSIAVFPACLTNRPRVVNVLALLCLWAHFSGGFLSIAIRSRLERRCL